jgi:hypothetical protein
MLEIEYRKSAFKHGASEADIAWAINTKVYDALFSEFPDKYALIGFNVAGNPIEVFYNKIDEDTICVFHAMSCRKTLMDAAGL